MITVQNKLKSELKQMADDTAKMLNAKPLNEAFETFTANSKVKEVIAEAGTKFNLSSVDVINKMKGRRWKNYQICYEKFHKQV